MKVFGRFLYALLAVGIFLWTFQYSIMDMRANYYKDVFGGSLVDESSDLPDFYYFYATLPGYHKDDPIISIDQDGYEVRGYEVAITSFEEDVLMIEETILLIVYHEDPEQLSRVDKLLITSDDARDQIEIELGRYHNLDILVSMDPNTSYYLFDKEDIDFSLNYTNISLVDPNYNQIIESVFTLAEEDFTIKDKLQTFYYVNAELPNVETIYQLNDPSINVQDQEITNNSFVVDEYIYIMGMYLGIYLVVLIVATYFIFFKKRKKKIIY
jgi:hypothetical protein